MTIGQTRANKTEAGNGSYGICRVIDASRPQRYTQRCGLARSPSPDPGRFTRVS